MQSHTILLTSALKVGAACFPMGIYLREEGQKREESTLYLCREPFILRSKYTHNQNHIFNICGLKYSLGKNSYCISARLFSIIQTKK